MAFEPSPNLIVKLQSDPNVMPQLSGNIFLFLKYLGSPKHTVAPVSTRKRAHSPQHVPRTKNCGAFFLIGVLLSNCVSVFSTLSKLGLSFAILAIDRHVG